VGYRWVSTGSGIWVMAQKSGFAAQISVQFIRVAIAVIFSPFNKTNYASPHYTHLDQKNDGTAASREIK
jgi:hypothetical protein